MRTTAVRSAVQLLTWSHQIISFFVVFVSLLFLFYITGHWVKDCRASFSPALWQPPLPQHPLTETLQEWDLKEPANPGVYDKFTDVLQVLNGFEIDENLGQSKNVKKKIKKQLRISVSLVASSFLLKIIKFGDRLPFWDTPPAYFSKKNVSALKKNEFVQSSTTELLASEYKKQVFYKSVVVNPLSVSVQPNGKNYDTRKFLI